MTIENNLVVIMFSTGSPGNRGIKTGKTQNQLELSLTDITNSSWDLVPSC